MTPVDYDTAVSAFFGPSPSGSRPGATDGASPARRLRDSIEPIAMHPVWSRQVNEALAAEGLDFLTAYLWGRAAALGEAVDAVVTATFAVFEPGMVGAIYEQGRRACTRDRLLQVRTDATIASLASVLEGEDVVPVADALQRAVAQADGTGRPLFSGLAAQGWPDDPVGRLWRACELAREHRGDSHVAACIARRLGPIEMNILTELWVGMPLGSYTATRGWADDRIQASAAALRDGGLLEGDGLSQAGRTMRDEIEATTDAMEASVVAALGSDLDTTISQLNRWSDRCISAGAFPPDVLKRAAG